MKMSILNITCIICTEVFQNFDDIHTTSCGHIFHYACLRNWQIRATSCPQCRLKKPTSHKLYLSFDSSDENPADIKELKVKLRSSNEKIQALYDQIREGDINFQRIQEQCTSSAQIIKSLKKRIAQSNESERNFLHLQAQCFESENVIKELLENEKLLTIDNASKLKELNLKSLEIATLKTSETSLTDQIKILEQKLAQSNDNETNFLHLQGKYIESENLIIELQENKQLLTDLKSLEITKLKISESVLKNKIKILDQKLQQYSDDFGKEFRISSIFIIIAFFVMIYNSI